ncbi:hypothetical protein BKA83DRAFT_678202 [Pisolithus microcarpus]|nr:hypothetical protein BKA83DRAFT_678202 [Pisolithus microcarpus]
MQTILVGTYLPQRKEQNRRIMGVVALDKLAGMSGGPRVWGVRVHNPLEKGRAIVASAAGVAGVLSLPLLVAMSVIARDMKT